MRIDRAWLALPSSRGDSVRRTPYTACGSAATLLLKRLQHTGRGRCVAQQRQQPLALDQPLRGVQRGVTRRCRKCSLFGRLPLSSVRPTVADIGDTDQFRAGSLGCGEADQVPKGVARVIAPITVSKAKPLKCWLLLCTKQGDTPTRQRQARDRPRGRRSTRPGRHAGTRSSEAIWHAPVPPRPGSVSFTRLAGPVIAHRTSMSLPPGRRDWLSLAASWIWSSV